MAFADARQAQPQFVFRGAVFDDRGEVRQQRLVHLRKGRRQRGGNGLAAAQPDALVSGQQGSGGDLFGQLQNAQRVRAAMVPMLTLS